MSVIRVSLTKVSGAKNNISILLTGGTGQLGYHLKQLFYEKKTAIPSFSLYTPTKNQLDICNEDQVVDFFSRNKIDVCIHTAAYTNVEKAELEKQLCYQTNTSSCDFLSRSCHKYDAKLIFISTDYVFDGKSTVPYREDNKTNPINVYGSSKAEAEKIIVANTDNFLILRTSWLFSLYGKNFLTNILRKGREKKELFIVDNQMGCPTYAKDLAEAIKFIIADRNFFTKKGIFHFSNKGLTSWYDFAKAIFDTKKCTAKVHPISYSNSKAQRPEYSVLDTSKFETEFTYFIRDWRKALQECLSG